MDIPHLTTTRLHLALALLAALTGTAYGVTTCLAALTVLALRRAAQLHLERSGTAGRVAAGTTSATVGARVLAPAQHADVLHAAGGAGQRPAA